MSQNNNISRRGFASLSPEKLRALAASGGKRSHELGKAHRWTSETAKIASRKGVLARTLQREGVRKNGKEEDSCL